VNSDPRHIRRLLLRALIPLAWMASIYFFSAQPDLNSGLGIWDFIGRKIIHAISFGTLSYLWFWTLRGTIRRPMIAAAATTFLYACSDEYHQTFVRGRHGTPRDVAIDSIGIAVAAWLANRQGTRRLRE
jgi:VanZ family protein